MEKALVKIFQGYQQFREKYHNNDDRMMERLAKGQTPQIMVVACCDSRVDPSILLQCAPGELFVVRNVANIIPPHERDNYHHGTSAALEFAICYLQVSHLIILGHSQCGGLNALLNKDQLKQDDFITHWVSLSPPQEDCPNDVDSYAKMSLNQSYLNCLTFPWIKERVDNNQLTIHRWFFDIKEATISTYHVNEQIYKELEYADLNQFKQSISR